MAKLKAILLNCSLKGKGDEPSSTEKLLGEVAEQLKKLDVTCSTVRIVDHNIKFGVEADMGGADEWPKIHDQIIASDIIVFGTPIWIGHRGSVCQMVLERMDAMLSETNDLGQLPLYNKVAGCCVVGNEDGAQNVSAGVLYNLMQFGATIPPNAEAYWVGLAGGEDDYVDLKKPHPYTQKLVEYISHNLVHLATMLKNNPIPAEGNKAE